MCVRVLREATSISEVSPSLDTCNNTLENVGRRAGNSHDGSTGGALGLHGFAKIIFGSATCHFFTKQVGKNGNPNRLGASGSFRALSFHVRLKSGVTNSKKIEKM
jgi:hypothetical protein